MRAIIWSAGVCAIAALLEALFAGGNIRRRLADLRTPPYTVPFWGWIVIGGLYYVMCFAVLFQLLRLTAGAPRTVALVLIGAFMFTNAFWNYFFFRKRNLFHAYLLGLVDSVIAVALFLLLFLRLHVDAAWNFMPYIIYLCYANIWGYRVWQLNLKVTP